ncbi:MAG: BamA/TamA family outer membrane protein [Chloroflexia bacterium]|nr:BamA/TamA family outer membrane protein [Chloroflexia bacterium]
MFEMESLNYMHNFAQTKLKINNLDDPFFPTKGIFVELAYKSLFNAQMSERIDDLYTQGFSPTNQIIKLNYQQYIRIKRKFSIMPQISIGVMENKSFLAQEFFIGGNNYQLSSNSLNMSGIKANNIIADNYIKIGLSAQLQVFDHWYLQYGQEALGFIDYQQVYSENEIIEGKSVTGWYCGLGISSRVGPIRLICSGSYEYTGLSWSLNLGIPF